MSNTDMSLMASPSSIPIYLINGVGTVWDAQVAATLHCVHNISGLRVGTLPGVSSQNGFLGLPLTLMQEETAYLVRQGIAHLVPVNPNPAGSLPSSEDVAQYESNRVTRIRQQEAAARYQEQEKAKVAKNKFAQAGAAAQAKREARARLRAEKAVAKSEDGELFGETPKAKAESVPPESAVVTSESERGIALPPDPDDTSEPIRGTHFHTVSPHPIFPHLAHGKPVTSVPHPLFTFPSTPRDRALLATFTRLLQLDLRIGLGPRFGGEYLVYPGDYLRYHAHFTSQILVRDEVIRPAEIVAWGRLGTGTKKAGLICCWDDAAGEKEERGDEEAEGEVEFYSLEWANFG